MTEELISIFPGRGDDLPKHSPLHNIVQGNADVQTTLRCDTHLRVRDLLRAADAMGGSGRIVSTFMPTSETKDGPRGATRAGRAG